MIGSLRWNCLFGAIGFIFTFIVSNQRNVMSTTLIRSAACGICLFLIVFLLRWGFSQIFNSAEETAHPDNQENHKGAHLDLVTPDEEIHPGLPRVDGSIDDQSFSPLKPPKLASKVNLPPDELAKALRHMSEE